MMRYLLTIFSLFFFIFLSFSSAQHNDDGNFLQKIGTNFSKKFIKNTAPRPTFLRYVKTKRTTNSPIASDREGVRSFFFDQKLDHFDDENKKTWKQKFLDNQVYYVMFKQIGPIFLMIDGEGTGISMDWMTFGFWVELAEKCGALLFQLEHRYYGQSFPTNVATRFLKKYLNIRQALADVANFITDMKESPLLKSKKWIVFGGSYAGALAAWMPSRYPHLVDGAVASSACFPMALEFSGFYESVSKALQSTRHGTKCTDEIKKATDQLIEVIEMGHQMAYLVINSIFKGDLNVNFNEKLQVAYFFSNLVEVAFVANDLSLNHPEELSINQICDIMTDEEVGNPIQRLAYVFDERNLDQSSEFNFKDYIDKRGNLNIKLSELIKYRSWCFQMCTEFGNIKTSNSTNEPFGPYLSIDLMILLHCTFTHGLTKDDVSNRITNSLEEKRQWELDFERTIFPVGDMDPWKGVQMTTEEAGDSVIMIQGGSHGEDMQPSTSEDSESLKNARRKIKKKVKEWIRAN